MNDSFRSVFDSDNLVRDRWHPIQLSPELAGPQADPTHKPIRDLVIAVIERAVIDYRECIERGLIRQGKVRQKKSRSFRYTGDHWHKANTEEVHQFVHGGTMDRLIDTWGIAVHPDAIRRGLKHYVKPPRQTARGRNGEGQTNLLVGRTA